MVYFKEICIEKWVPKSKYTLSPLLFVYQIEAFKENHFVWDEKSVRCSFLRHSRRKSYWFSSGDMYQQLQARRHSRRVIWFWMELYITGKFFVG